MCSVSPPSCLHTLLFLRRHSEQLHRSESLYLLLQSRESAKAEGAWGFNPTKKNQR